MNEEEPEEDMMAVEGYSKGWTVGEDEDKREAKNSHARRVLIYAVLSVWVFSFIADIYIEGYEPSPFIHMAMMTILGALFGREVLGKNGSSQ